MYSRIVFCIYAPPFCRFNKGVIANVLDFLLVPGFSTNYLTILDIPEAVKTPNKAKSTAPTQKVGAAATESSTMNALHAQSQAASHTHGPNCNHGHDGDRHL